MNQVTPKTSPFESESIGRLIVKFAVPSIISLMVNSLYNIVDQIFIGQGVGFLGNAATNVAFPFVTISMAFALLVGDGCAAAFSLNLGRRDADAARQCVGNALSVSLLLGLVFLGVGLGFTTSLLWLFGATADVMPYALEYIRIVVLGLPFVIIGITLNSVIRADGSPRFAMCSMLLGAVINTILDPIFIFLFHWGVAGAAFATILGQIASFVLSAFYLKRFKNITFSLKQMRPRFPIIRRVLSLGLSSFVTQMAITVVIIIMNNTLVIYGAASAYGSEIPLAALGIVMKVNQIMMAVLIGISAGTQPIVGYNYGAGNYARVKKSYLISVSIATGWAVLAFFCFQFLNGPIISLFGQESDMYNAFAQKCFRVYLMMVFLNGFQIVSSIFFQAIGKPVQATLLSLSRQILFFIPALLVLPRFFGIDGALYAGPFADAMAFLLALAFILVEMRLLSKQHKTMSIVSSCEAPAEG